MPDNLAIILCFVRMSQGQSPEKTKKMLASNVSANVFTFAHVIGHHTDISTANVRFTLHICNRGGGEGVRSQGCQLSDSCLSLLVT